jgi:stage III sporulation protein AE
MKKKRLIFCIMLAIGMFFIISASAVAVDIMEEQSDSVGADELPGALPGDARDILGGFTVTDALDADAGLNRIFSSIGDRLKGLIAPSLTSAAVIVAAAVLSGLFTSVFTDKSSNYAVLAGIFAVSAVSVSSVNTFIGLASRTLDDMDSFSRMLLPCLTAASASSGAFTGAAVKYAATVLFMDVLMSLLRSVIMPLIYTYCAISIAEAAVGSEALSGAAALVKWLMKTALSVFVLAFVAYVSITGIIAASTDAVAVRTAKVAISTVLPVVGGILADAADTVLSGASILRNAIGIFGLLAVAAMCISPFIRMGAHYLLFKAAAGLSGAVADKRISKLVDSFAAAFGITLAASGACAAMLFVSIVSTIKAMA